jgi:hypothetical protein
MSDKPQTTDLTDIVTWMRKTDACHEPAEANALLTAGAAEITRLRELGRKIARPWIDGGVTAKEWCEAVDAFCPARSAESV